MVAAISGDHVDVLQGGEESPSNVNAAGQEQIQVFARQDPQRPNGFWLWAASDNLRISSVERREVRRGHDRFATAREGTVKVLHWRRSWLAAMLAQLLLGLTSCGYHATGKMRRACRATCIPFTSRGLLTLPRPITLDDLDRGSVKELRKRTNYRIVTTNDGSADAVSTGTSSPVRCATDL